LGTLFLSVQYRAVFVFSSAVFIPLGENNTEAFLYYAVILMTLLSGSILSYSTSLPSLLLFMTISIFPLIIKCFLMQEFLFTVLGSTLSFGYVPLSKQIQRMNKLLLENISLKNCKAIPIA